MSFPIKLLTMFSVMCMPVAGWCQAPPKIAVMVGINEYNQDYLNKPKPLQYAENDAKAMKQLLERAGYKVYLLLGKEATRKKIEVTLIEARKETGAGGVFLIGFAGHGFQPEKGEEAYFCPFDADKKAKPKAGEDPWDYSTMFPLSDALSYLKSSSASSRLLLMDACRNDPLAGRGRGVGVNLKVADIPNTAVLLSCSAGQKSFEDKAWGGGHGVFFHHVIRGLSGAEPSTLNSNHVDIDLLWTYLKKQVPEQVKEVAKDPFSGTAPDQKPFRIVNGDIDLQILAKAGSGVIPKMLPKEPKNGNTVTVDLGGGEKMEFVRIPKGKNQVGSSAADLKKIKELFDESPDDEPLKEFELGYELLMGETHVTVGQFKRFVEETKHKTDGEKNGSYRFDIEQKKFVLDQKINWQTPGFDQDQDHPVVCVSWNDAKAYCEWLKGKVEKQFGAKYKVRLPEEYEWEYACRAGSQSLWNFGDDPEKLADHANVGDASLKKAIANWPYLTIKGNDGHAYTMPVKAKKANRFGLYGMHGNAWQWCENLYTSDKTDRVLRGGSWFNFPYRARAAYRFYGTPVNSDYDVGFRVVLLP